MAALTQRAVRRALTERLADRGAELRLKIWRDLVSSRYVDLVLRGRWDIERLAAAYSQKEETYYPPRVPRHEVVREVEDDDARARALSEMLARLLCGICDVTDFRAQVLGNQLRSAQELPRWIADQARLEGPVTGHYVMVPAPSDERQNWRVTHNVAAYAEWLAERARRVAEDPASELPQGTTQGSLDLEYAMPRGGAGRIEIRGDGILARLKTVVSGVMGLCAFAGWSESAAVAFVVCDQIPRHRTGTVAVRHGVYPAAAQIELAVSANMSVTEVAELYQEVRRQVRGACERSMDEKHLALALFIDEHKESGRGWRQLHERWNASHPEWHYETDNDPHSRRFALEARRTWSRLTGETWRDLRDEPAWRHSAAQ